MTAPAPQSQPEAAPVRQHTPTPWRISTQKWYPWPYAVGIEGTQPANFEHDTICWTTTGGTKNHEANAAFIVEAVNSHAALRARVDELTKALEEIASKDQHRIFDANLRAAWIDGPCAGIARRALGISLERSGGAT